MCLLGRALYKLDLADFPPCAEGAGCRRPIYGRKRSGLPRTNRRIGAHAPGALPAPDTGSRLPTPSGGWCREGNRGTERSGRAELGLSQIRGPQSPPSQRHPHRLSSGPARAAVWHHVWQIKGENDAKQVVNKPWLLQALAPPLLPLPWYTSPTSLADLGVVRGFGQHRCNVKELPALPPITPPQVPEGQDPIRS